MVCKNCGADLKPGVKYCLNCGSYIDDDEIETAGEPKEELIKIEDSSYEDDMPKIEEDIVEEKPKKKKKKRKSRIKPLDIIIYLGLISIIVVSIVIIVITLKKPDTSNTPVETPVLEDSKVTMSDYTVTIPGKLRYTTESNRLYVSDNTNFTFSFNVTEDTYQKYADDLTILSKQMEKSGYTVENSEKKVNGTEEFLIYRIKVNSTTKYFYVTAVDEKYTLMGIIEVLESGNWEEALPNITTVKKSMVFNNTANEVQNAAEEDAQIN